MKIDKQTTESEVIYLTPETICGPQVHIHRFPKRVMLTGILGPSAEGATLEDALFALAKEYQRKAAELGNIATDLEAFAPEAGETPEP